MVWRLKVSSRAEQLKRVGEILLLCLRDIRDEIS